MHAHSPGSIRLMMALTPKRLFLSLCISISLLRSYTFFSRSPLVFKSLFEIYTGATQTETSLLKQYVAGERVDLLDEVLSNVPEPILWHERSPVLHKLQATLAHRVIQSPSCGEGFYQFRLWLGSLWPAPRSKRSRGPGCHGASEGVMITLCEKKKRIRSRSIDWRFLQLWQLLTRRGNRSQMADM